MNDIPSVGVDVMRATPLFSAAGMLTFFDLYGSMLVTGMALAYGVYQFWCRRREHKAIMLKNKV